MSGIIASRRGVGVGVGVEVGVGGIGVAVGVGVGIGVGVGTGTAVGVGVGIGVGTGVTVGVGGTVAVGNGGEVGVGVTVACSLQPTRINNTIKGKHFIANLREGLISPPRTGTIDLGKITFKLYYIRIFHIQTGYMGFDSQSFSVESFGLWLIKAIMFDRLSEMSRRIVEIDELMSDPAIATDTPQLILLNKERASLMPVVTSYTQYVSNQNAIEEARGIIEDATDQDLVMLAKDEIGLLEAKQVELEEGLKKALLPKDPSDSRDVFVEIRAGAGGDEASMFAAELYRMYSRYAQLKGWRVELVDTNDSGVGGLKEVIFEIKGEDVYSRLKFENGAHRVQRVPTTESSGRLHTSTATVAVLPEAEEVDVEIKADDLKIDVFHAGGAGGQNVNKVATAIRITHLPTGIVAVCQDERSQLRNKEKAMNVLRARLYDKAHREHQETLSRERKIKVGTGERSEKIRTYNYPQDRITDHRINKSFHNMQSILSGNIDEIINMIDEEQKNQNLYES